MYRHRRAIKRKSLMRGGVGNPSALRAYGHSFRTQKPIVGRIESNHRFVVGAYMDIADAANVHLCPVVFAVRQGLRRRDSGEDSVKKEGRGPMRSSHGFILHIDRFNQRLTVFRPMG